MPKWKQTICVRCVFSEFFAVVIAISHSNRRCQSVLLPLGTPIYVLVFCFVLVWNSRTALHVCEKLVFDNLLWQLAWFWFQSIYSLLSMRMLLTLTKLHIILTNVTCNECKGENADWFQQTLKHVRTHIKRQNKRNKKKNGCFHLRKQASEQNNSRKIDMKRTNERTNEWAIQFNYYDVIWLLLSCAALICLL